MTIDDALLARCSALVYMPWFQVRSACQEWGADDYAEWDIDGTQAFLAQFGNDCIVTFAGTAEVRDWLTNFNAELERWRVGRVHRGFLLSASYVLSEIVLKIGKLNRSKNGGSLSIHATGHSLGAAEATLFSGTMANRKQGPIELVTFGSPRVGNRVFADWFNWDSGIRCRRYVNNNDAVTLVPGWIHGYRHVGRLMYFNGGNVIKSPSVWQRIKWGVAGAVNHIGVMGIDCIEDHRVGKYVEATAA